MKKIAALCAILFVNISLAQTVCFKSMDDYAFTQIYSSNTITAQNASAIGDFNNDLNNDVITSGSGSLLLFFPGNGTGTFTTNTNFTHPNLTFNVQKILKGDFDNNGNLDLALVNTNGSSKYGIQILYGNGAGWFTPGTQYTIAITSSDQINSLNTADFNNDGYTDILISQDNFLSNPIQTIKLYLNSSTGNLTLTNPVPTMTSTCLTYIKDVNNDGNQDIVYSGYAGWVVGAYLGFGNGTFSVTPTSVSSNSLSSIYNFGYYDLNNDGKSDVIEQDYTLYKILYQLKTPSGFTPTYTITTDFPTNSIKVADMNGDGSNDIIAYYDSLKSVEIFLNNGLSTGFTPSGKIAVPGGLGLTGGNLDYSIGNLNSDGIKDIAVPGALYAKLSVIIGNTSGVYPSPTVLLPDIGSVQTYFMGVATGDFNNDGYNDFIPSSGNGTYIYNYLGSSSGNFSVVTTTISNPIGGRVYAADFNNDGSKDLFVFDDDQSNNGNTSGMYAIYANIGGGMFGTLNTVKNNTMATITSLDVALADFDNDGNTDIVTANSSPFGYSIIKGNGTFSPTPVGTTSLSSNSTDVVSGDFNNDGNMDFITVNGGSKFNVLLGNGNCTFQAAVTYTTPSICSIITAGDYNGDAFKDIALIRNVSGTVSLLIYFGTGTGSFVLNQTSSVNGGIYDIASSDLNNDGKDEIVVSVDGAINNIWIGVGNSSNFYVFKKFTIARAPYQLGFIDLNNDGAKDIVVPDLYPRSPVKIMWNTTPVLNSALSNATICPGGVGYLSIPPNSNILWNTGNTSNVQMVTTPGIYTVSSGNFSGGCTTTNTFVVVTSTTSATPVTITNTNTSLCKNSNTITLTSNPSGSNFAGPGVSGSVFNPSSAITGTNTIYALYTNTSSCISVDSIVFTINPTPSVFAGNDTLICKKAVITLTGQGTATSYTWNNSVANTVPFVPNSIPVAGIDYVVTGTNGFGCFKRDTINVKADPSCNTVWPGDTDEDGAVTTNDFLVLGLGYGLTGPARTFTSNAWAAQDSYFWNALVSSTTYTACYLDCNGNGTINFGDTLAVNLNFGLTHLVKDNAPVQSMALNDVYFQFNKATYLPGDTIKADILIGSSTNQMTGFYGTSFYITYNTANVKTGSEKLIYNNSWIGNINSSKMVFKNFQTSSGRVDGAVVKITHNDTIGFGKIGRLTVVLKDTLADGYSLFSIRNAVKMNSVGIITPLVSGTDSIQIANNAIGINEIDASSIGLYLYPNPSRGTLYVKSKEEMTAIEITNVVGELVYKTKLQTTTTNLILQNISSGCYFVKVVCSGKEYIRKIILDTN